MEGNNEIDGCAGAGERHNWIRKKGKKGKATIFSMTGAGASINLLFLFFVVLVLKMLLQILAAIDV